MKDDLGFGWTSVPDLGPALECGAPPARGAALRPLSALRVVAIGGGTGLPVVLNGLKRPMLDARPRSSPPSPERLTAVVTVADDGGSSGRLRRAYGVLAPGDIRNCLLALANDATMSRLFGFRFAGASEVSGHSLGNLILTALSLEHGDFSEAIRRAEEILGVEGRVLASTAESVSLVAELDDGRRVRGESAIGRATARVRRLRLEPEGAALLAEAREALRRAHLVVVGPGSLYTSLLPPLLLEGLAEAVAESGARVVLVMNVMTEPESVGLKASDHVEALRRHAPRLPIHDVLLNTTPIPERVCARYAARGALPVVCDEVELAALGCRPVARSLLAQSRKVRHDPDAVADALLELVAQDRSASLRADFTARAAPWPS